MPQSSPGGGDGVPAAVAAVHQDFFTANSIFVACACALLVWVAWQGYRRERFEFLRLWCISWLSYLAARLLTMVLIRPRTGIAWENLQPVVSAIAQVGYFVHVWLLVVCLLALARGQAPRISRRRCLWIGSAILTLAVGLTLWTVDADRSLRLGVRIGFRCAVTAVAFAICGTMLIAFGLRIRRLGASFAGVTLLGGSGAYALHAWAFMGGPYYALAAYLGAFEILTVSAIGLGLLLWLGEDRNREAQRVNRELGERTQALLQAQRLESLGQLAGGVSHDFNNVLTVIIANTELLLLQSDMTKRMRAQIQETHDAAQHAAKMTGQLLALAREPASTRRVIDLAAETQAIKPLLRSLAGPRVRVQVEISGAPVRALLDRGHLEQILINLVTNARDAIVEEPTSHPRSQGSGDPNPMNAPRKGTILVSVRQEEIDGIAFVTISAADNGAGMAEEVRERVGELFFTTKGGRGTGMGMASVRSILASTDGDLSIASAPGKGATVTVRWPAVGANGQLLTPIQPSVPASDEPRQRTVLLAEDDPLVRRVTARALEGSGYRVLAEDTPAAAIDCAMRHDGPIDLLLSDVIMPGLGGPDLAARVRELRPTIAVRFISGYLDESQTAQLLELGPLLNKPFTRQELLAFVRAALPAESAATGESVR
ncbi:MAG: ATP-binding protein [bacterium]|nr:ATP-binding protein [bacterium]